MDAQNAWFCVVGLRRPAEDQTAHIDADIACHAIVRLSLSVTKC